MHGTSGAPLRFALATHFTARSSMNAFASSEMEGTSSIPCRPGREAACWAQIPLRNLRYIAWTKLAHLVLRQVLQPRQLHQDTVFNEAILAKVGTQAASLAGVPPINCRNGGQRGQVRHRCSSHSAKPPGRHAEAGAGGGREVLASAGAGSRLQGGPRGCFCSPGHDRACCRGRGANNSCHQCREWASQSRQLLLHLDCVHSLDTGVVGFAAYTDTAAGGWHRRPGENSPQICSPCSKTSILLQGVGHV